MWSFMNTDKEKHAAIIGFFETWPIPWPARFKLTKDSEYDARDEYHYYLMGRSFGFLLDIPLYYGIVQLFT